jgi:hypothetical protein
MTSKNLILIALAISLFGTACGEKKEIKESDTYTQLDKSLVSFLNENKGWNKNDIKEKEMNEKFKVFADSIMRSGEFGSIPLRLASMNELNDSIVACHFTSSTTATHKFELDGTTYEVLGDWIVLGTRDQFLELEEKRKYLVSGDFAGRIKHIDEIQNYSFYPPHSPYVNISKEIIGTNVEIELGVNLVEKGTVSLY